MKKLTKWSSTESQWRFNCGSWISKGKRQSRRWRLGDDGKHAEKVASVIKATWKANKLRDGKSALWSQEQIQAMEALRQGVDLPMREQPQASQAIALQPQLEVVQRKQPQLTIGQTGMTLYTAFDSYLNWVKSEAMGGQITKGMITYRTDIITAIKLFIADRPLQTVDYDCIRGFVNLMTSRPNSQRGKPISATTASKRIDTFQHFLRWARKTKRWISDLDFDDVFEFNRKKLEDKDRDADGADDEQREYSIEELKTIWRCSRYEKIQLYILLALNCGMGQKEISTLRKSSLHLDHFNSKGKWCPFIQRRRNKTGVPCKYRLWKETAYLIQKHLAPTNTAGDKGEDLAFLRNDGKTLVEFSERRDAIDVAWSSLINRCDKLLKLLPEFSAVADPKNFYAVRKTGGNMVQRISGNPYLSQVFLAHGRSTLAEKSYLNRDYAKLAKCLLKMRRKLQPMFDAGDYDSLQLTEKAKQLEEKYRTIVSKTLILKLAFPTNGGRGTQSG